MLNTIAYCPDCGRTLITEDVEKVETPDGTIYDNPMCKGFTRGDMVDEHFGASNAEELAMGLYRLYHKEDEDGWKYMAAERSDDVVKSFRVLALMLCDIAEHQAIEHGIGSTYYG